MPSLNTGNAILSNPIKVDSSYNVGIGGAASGSFKLQVTGTTSLTDNLTMTIASGTKSIGFGGNTIAAAANALIYSDTNYLVLNSKAGSPLYLNFDNTNASSTINMFNGKFILTQPGAATFSSASSIIANNQGIRVYSTDSQAADLGGGISFGGYYVGTSTTADFANIKSGKDNSTSGNYAGYLAFSTNAQATGNVERMRIKSNGDVLIKTALRISDDTTWGLSIYKWSATASPIIEADGGQALSFGNGGSEKMRIFANGNVAIQDTFVDNGAKLCITSGAKGAMRINTDATYNAISIGGTGIISIDYPGVGAGRFSISDNGNVGMPRTYGFTTSNAANLFIDSSGLLYRSTSSLKYKTNVEDLKINTTDLLSKMRPVWYRSTGDADRKDWSWYGFIAEELAEIEPRLVHFGYGKDSYEEVETKDEKGDIKIETKLKSNAVKDEPDGVQYERITVLLVAEMQKQNKIIQELKEEIEAQQQQINSLINR